MMKSKKKKSKTDQVLVHVELIMRGHISKMMPRAEADALIEAADSEWKGDTDASQLPFDIDWLDVINSGEAIVDDLWIKEK